MRTLIVDAGNDLDYTRAKAGGFTGAAYDVRDPRLTPAYLAGVASRGIVPELFVAWNWPETGVRPPYEGTAKGLAFADYIERAIAPLATADPAMPGVLIDAETHDVPFLLAMLARYRSHRPRRTTGWTLEAFQGGLFSPNDTLRIAAANVAIAPGFYEGDMTPLDAVAVVLDLCSYSFPPGRIVGMYDAARLPAVWTGYAFTQGRLP